TMQLRRVDLVAVVVLFGFTAGLAMPAVHQAGKQNDLDTTKNNLKQMALASHNVHDTHNRLPHIAGELGGKKGSLHYHLLPYIEQTPAYQKGHLGAVIDIMRTPGDRSAPADGTYKKTFGTTS